MDPVSLIIAAVLTGAAAGASKTADQSVSDAYGYLKGLIRRRLKDAQEPETALASIEIEPEAWKEPLKAAIVRAGASDDEEIVETARRLLSLANPGQQADGKYSVQIAGNVQGLVQGDHAHVDMNFSGPAEPNP
jgi:hypothetical protein